MIAKLLCGTLSLGLLGTAPPAQPTGPRELYSHIVRVDCANARGTAFQIADGRYLTAAHVSSNPRCKIAGQPIEAVAEDGLDFAVIQARGRGFKINCDGFQTGSYVFAIGYAGGFSWQTMTRLFVTYKSTDDGMRYLLGSPSVIPGMSGGPVLNSKGEVVGVVNRYMPGFPLSFSRALRDTSLCPRS